jgi:hypothetical protein
LVSRHLAPPDRPAELQKLGILTAALLALGCAPSAAAPGSAPRAVERCRYDIRVESARPLRLDVSASCQGPAVAGLALSQAEQFPYITTPTAQGESLRRRGQGFELSRPRANPVFRYHVDLESAARDHGSFDFAVRHGDSLLAPASTFLLHPLPLELDVPVEVRVHTPPGFGFDTGLERRGDAYHLEAHEIPVATYSVFGRYATRALPVEPGRKIDLVILDGKRRLADDELAAWVERRARVVSSFYGRLPAERVVVFLVPAARRHQVAFGKLLPESAPGIVVLLGSEADEEDLERDWILIHELFHVGVPSFYKEGKWFDEGLATYFEPILRVRAGLLTEAELWQDFARQMPRGVPALTQFGLERSPDYASVYWGGAVFCLTADVEIRTSSGLVKGLEDGVRAVFDAGGIAWDVWSLERTLSIADRNLGDPVLARLARRYAERPAPFDLDDVLRRLGVIRHENGIELRDDAPLAAVRRAIVRPPPPP